jgi:hypothetical protein
MGATIIKIKIDENTGLKKPLSSLQKKLLETPVMTNKEYQEYKKMNKWMGKWKI